MKKFTVLFFIFSSAYAGEENNKATAIQMAPVEVLETVKVKKHIKEVYFKPLPKNTNGLLSLSELPEFIEYLAKINYSRKLKIFFE